MNPNTPQAESSPLRVHSLSDRLAVAPQIGPEHVQAIAEAGFKSIICNRPDFEHGPHQATWADVKAEADRHGLAFAFHPVDGGGQTPDEALEMAKLMRELPKPILAYCRSGRRCISLVSLAAQLGQDIPA